MNVGHKLVKRKVSFKYHLPRFTTSLHIISQRNVVGPHVVLPLTEPQDAAKYPAGMYADPHVQLDIRGFDHAGDGIDHVQTHLHGAVGVVRARFRQARDAVVAVAEDFDPEAMVILEEKK